MKWIGIIALLCLVSSGIGYHLGYRGERRGQSNATAAIGRVTENVAPLDLTAPKSRSRTDEALADRLVEAIEGKRRSGWRRQLSKGQAWLSSAELDDILSALGDAEIEDKSQWYHALLGAWARHDAEGALEFACEELESSVQYQGLCAIFTALAEKDPGEAFARWEDVLTEVEDPLWAQGALLPITDAWWQRDLEGAVNAISGIAGESDRYSAINGLFSSSFYKASEPERARLWTQLRQLEDPATRNHAHRAYANALASQQSLQEMEQWMSDQGLRGEALAHAERGIARRHLEENPKRAAEWLGQRATEASLSGHLLDVIVRWAMHEPNAAGEWLGVFPVSGATDAATLAYANTVSHDDLESAFHWATRIQDPSQRVESLRRLTKRWVTKDPAAAQDAVQQTELSDSERAALSEVLELQNGGR